MNLDDQNKKVSEDVLDFAPGLLAIQEKPPARLPKAVLYSVCLLFFILLLWAFFGKLDIVATADGRLVPQSFVKIVQPAEAGIIREILVEEGMSVAEGQVLMRMDTKMTEADSRSIEDQFQQARMQLRRIDAELAGQPMKRQPDDPADLFEQAEQQYQAHRRVYLDAIAQENEILQKTRHDLQAALEQLQKLREVLPTFRKRAEAFNTLQQEGFYSQIEAAEREREYIEHQQDLEAQLAKVASLKASLAASQKQLTQITSQYRSELQNERVATEKEYRQLREEREKIQHKSSLMSLRASQDGVVKDLLTHTAGTVVSPGTVMMSLVPHNDPLQAEVYIRNEDVGFVHTGQKVKLKLAAYPFQKYGMIDGTVVFVGPDVSEQQQAKEPEQKNSGLRQHPPGLRYKARIKLAQQHLDTNGFKMDLTAGMQVVADIHLGRRTVMEYILSPVSKAWQEAGRER